MDVVAQIILLIASVVFLAWSVIGLVKAIRGKKKRQDDGADVK